MQVKKYKGKIFGMAMTADERKALQMELRKEIAELDNKYAADIDALMLYVLASRYGWRKKRLLEIWHAFAEEHKRLCEYYQMDGAGDSEWLAHHELAKIGVDVRKWEQGEFD